ncbi:hypothetical protein [Pseudoroseomonas ludipueritiae]|uniref:WGR domain-containing protein n=1 Tax=Pseudoroseomonas ludipueritiae TaxID=198093 RepID=A0ABR7R4U6_9PROT|nr:hypothetical protein [Pseudoroseomonas ludipueritiae]MBC9176784.1 hypothetical protein [Pseudoroseomonas ludipueritiae]
MSEFRVVVAYRYAKRNGGVAYGMTIKAENEEGAIAEGHRKILQGYRSRRHAYTTCEKLPAPPAAPQISAEQRDEPHG